MSLEETEAASVGCAEAGSSPARVSIPAAHRGSATAVGEADGEFRCVLRVWASPPGHCPRNLF